jgi:hypothetical protein
MGTQTCAVPYYWGQVHISNALSLLNIRECIEVSESEGVVW